MNGELDPADKALLKDIAVFNRTYATDGWHIRDKVVVEDLSGIQLFRSSLTAVRVLHVNWKSAVLEYSHFTNVRFEQSKFTAAELRGVVFTDCKFVICSFEKATLTDCRFINCTTEELTARGATFQGCVFDTFEERSGVFDSATLRNCRFEKCRLDNTSFDSTEFDMVPFKRSALKNVIFYDIRGTGLAFEDATLYNCGFEESRYGSVTFERGNSKGITFNGFHTEGLRIQNCEMIEALTIRDSTWLRPSITGCRAVSELTIGGSRIKNLTMADNQIAYLRIEETEISGDSRITGNTIVGLNLEKSTLVGTQMANCAVSSYLMLDGATLDAVALSGMTYADGLRVSARDVKYLNGSEMFGSR